MQGYRERMRINQVVRELELEMTEQVQIKLFYEDVYRLMLLFYKIT